MQRRTATKRPTPLLLLPFCIRPRSLTGHRKPPYGVFQGLKSNLQCVTFEDVPPEVNGYQHPHKIAKIRRPPADGPKEYRNDVSRIDDPLDGEPLTDPRANLSAKESRGQRLRFVPAHLHVFWAEVCAPRKRWLVYCVSTLAKGVLEEVEKKEEPVDHAENEEKRAE